MAKKYADKSINLYNILFNCCRDILLLSLSQYSSEGISKVIWNRLKILKKTGRDEERIGK